MTAFQESVKGFISEVQYFVNETLRQEKLSKQAQQQKSRIFDLIYELKNEYPLLLPSEIDNISIEDDGFPHIAARDLMNVAKAGFLEKRRKKEVRLRGIYQRRYCVVEYGVFYYYSSPTDKRQAGAFSLHGYKVHKAAYLPSDPSKGVLSFELTGAGKRTYQFLAESKHDLQEWTVAVEKYNGLEKKNKQIPDLQKPAPPAQESTPEVSTSDQINDDIYIDVHSDDDLDSYDDVEAKKFEDDDDAIYTEPIEQPTDFAKVEPKQPTRPQYRRHEKEVQNKPLPNLPADGNQHRPDKDQIRSPDKHQHHYPDKHQNHSPDKHKNYSPDKHQKRSPERQHTPQHHNVSPEKTQHRSTENHSPPTPTRTAGRVDKPALQPPQQNHHGKQKEKPSASELPPKPTGTPTTKVVQKPKHPPPVAPKVGKKPTKPASISRQESEDYTDVESRRMSEGEENYTDVQSVVKTASPPRNGSPERVGEINEALQAHDQRANDKGAIGHDGMDYENAITAIRH